jgi:hypothetical protein
MGIWSQMSVVARRQLYDTLGGMLGETPAAEDSSGAPSDSKVPSTLRPWERPILKDIPLFQEFGKLTKKQRGTDSRGIPQLISISQGVVSRGVKAKHTERAIAQAIEANLGNPDLLRSLFIPTEDQDPNQETGDPSTVNLDRSANNDDNDTDAQMGD